MLYSSADIVRVLASDPIIRLTAKVETVDEKYPLLSFGEGIYIYVAKYPATSDLQAIWDAWIVTYDDEPLDVILSQIKKILPNVQILSEDTVIHITVNELISDRTVTRPVAIRQPENPDYIFKSVNETISDLEFRFQQLAEEIQDKMLLVGPGRAGHDGKDGKDGIDGKDGKDGVDFLATEAELDDLRDVVVTDAERGQVLTYDGDTWVPRFIPRLVSSSTASGGGAINEITSATGEPMGHTDRTDSTIAFDKVTRTFSIEPNDSSFEIWCKGKKYTIYDKQELILPNVSGFYYIYFDPEGELQYRTSYFDWPNDCMTAYVYWNATIQELIYFGDERHGIILDWQTHEYLHRTRGAAIANGFNISNYTIIGDGSLDSHAQIDLGSGTFFDEDLQVDVIHSNTPEPNSWQQDLKGPARIPVIYHINSTWYVSAETNFPLIFGNNYPVFNRLNGGTWSTIDASVNKYIYTFIIASNNLNHPVLAIMGQGEYTNIAHAEEVSFSDLDLAGFPSLEFRPLFKLIYQVGNYPNSINARLRSAQDYRVSSSLTVANAGITFHGDLTGLDEDDHQQYVHVSDARTISANHTMTGGLTISGSTLLGTNNSIVSGFELNGGDF